MIRFIYNLLWPIGLLFFLPGYLLKMVRRGGYREKFEQRLGVYDRELRVRLSNQKSTWLHAVSVGEVNIAFKLARALRVLEPDLHCVLTTTTTTGFALARKTAPPWIEVMYTPLDYWPVMRRAFFVIRPARILLVEAEVWPNLVAFAHGCRIPIALVNARLSTKSEKRFHRFRIVVGPTFRLLDLICIQEPEDEDRWQRLGVDRSRIKWTGSIKYDPDGLERIKPAAELFGVPPSGGSADDSLADSPRRLKPELRTMTAEVHEGTGEVVLLRFDPEHLVLFGGSTHHGEEEVLATVFLRLRGEFPSLRLFIAPRHVERLREIRSQLNALGLRIALASEFIGGENEGADCVLLDSTGQLQQWYGIATVVFMGKSLTAHGGQNPVEPILAGKPVLFGPHMENFALLAKTLVSKQGAIQVSDAHSLERLVIELLRDKEARGRLVQNARQVLSAHQGATARAATLIHELRPL
jgi:3-deoxy-D-manno-octulosonic-acid transferase